MTPADRALAEAIRAELRVWWLRISISGLDGAGKSTLCAALANALDLPVVRVPDRDMVRRVMERGRPAGYAQVVALGWQRREMTEREIMDRGPLCIAAIHPDAEPGALREAAHVDLTLFLDLPLEAARARKADPEAEARDRDAEARRYRELAARWPRTVVIDASQPPEAVLSAALRAVARAVGVAL